MSQSREPCEFCATCSRPACEKKDVVSPTPKPLPVTPVVPTPVPKPTPVPVPTPVPQPTPNPVPTPIPTPSGSVKSVREWFTQDMWDMIVPYADLSAVYCPTDKKPMYSREAFFEAIDWMNAHPNKMFHGFGTSGSELINKYEIAAFLANFSQECGSPDLKSPFPYLWPKADPQTAPYVGMAGGGVALIEGVAPMMVAHKKGTACPVQGQMMYTMDNPRPMVKKVLGLRDDDVLTSVVQSLAGANQPGFGLGTGNVAFTEKGLAAVSDDGTVYGDVDSSIKDTVVPASKWVRSTTDRKYACLGMYCQYSGKHSTQLSYWFNYSACSVDLFGDYRLVRYPNLLVTVDRENWNGFPATFGFAGPNTGGKNRLPTEIDRTTPNARITGFLSTFWFWMGPRSGRPISCHEAMLKPEKYGITSVCLIVNNESGLNGGWASQKLDYYKRICAILNIPVGNTIVSPPGIK